MRRSSWIEQVDAWSVADVARRFGLDVATRAGSTSAGPCPLCGDKTRHHKSDDKRGALGLRPDGRGWRCFQCDGAGDAVALAAACVLETVRPGQTGWATVRRACAERGLCDADPRDGGAALVVQRPARPSPMPAPAPPKRPPLAEVSALWAASRSVLEDRDVAAYLRTRGLDPGAVESRDLARALPRGCPVPQWAHFGSGANWPAQGYRLIFQLWTAAGELASVRARSVMPGAKLKSVAPTGFDVRGLVLADPLGRLLLAGAPLGDGTSAAELVARVGISIAEGETDWLTLATHWTDASELAPAVLGVMSGSWREDSADLAERVPEGCCVRLYCDLDPAGDLYASAIRRSLLGRRVAVERWRPRDTT